MSNEIERPNDYIRISRSELAAMIDHHCDVRLGSFGIDWESTDGKREFIEDMLFIRRLRQSIARVHHAGVVSLVVTAITAILGLIWVGFKNTPIR